MTYARSVMSRLAMSWLVMAFVYGLVLTCMPTTLVAQETPARQFAVGQKVEYKFGGMWQEGVIRRVAGDLFLVANPRFNHEGGWHWMPAEMIRKPGEAHEGPGPFDQFRHMVGGDSIPASLVKAQQKYKEHVDKQASGGRMPGRRGRLAGRAGQRLGNPADDQSKPDAEKAVEYALADIDKSSSRSLSVASLLNTPGLTGQASKLDPATAFPAQPWKMTVKDDSQRLPSRAIVLTANGRMGLVVLQDGMLDTATLTVERFDLMTGRSAGHSSFKATSLPKDISMDGQMIAAVNNASMPSDQRRVDLWDWSKAEPVHVVSFEAVSDERMDHLKSVQLLGDGSMLVKQNNGDVSAYDARSNEVSRRWSFNLSWVNPLEPSPGRRQIAVAMDDKVVLIDAITGEALASIDANGLRPRSLCFSPSGRYVLLSNHSLYARWDLQAGQLSPRYALPMGMNPQQLLISDTGHVFIGMTMLDPASGAAVMRYEPGMVIGDATIAPGMLLGMITRFKQNGGSQIWIWPAPKQLPQAQLDVVPNLFAPGAQVSIDLSGMDANAEDKQKLLTALTEQLAEMKVTVAPSAVVKISVQSTAETKQQEYRDLHGRGQTQTATVTTRKTMLTIDDGGKPVWKYTSVSDGSVGAVRLNEGETLQQALDRQTQRGGPGLGGMILPEIIPAAHAVADAPSAQLGSLQNNNSSPTTDNSTRTRAMQQRRQRRGP